MRITAGSRCAARSPSSAAARSRCSRTTASPVTCAVPAGVDLSGFKVSDRVEMRCANVNGTLTLASGVKKDDDDDDGGGGGRRRPSRASRVLALRPPARAGGRRADRRALRGARPDGLRRLPADAARPGRGRGCGQQTFLSAYRGAARGQDPREPSAWLGTIARNECRTRLRARRTEPLTLVREPVGDELQREVDRHDEIRGALRGARRAAAAAARRDRAARVLRPLLRRGRRGARAVGRGGRVGASSAAGSACRTSCARARSALGVLTLPLSLRDSLAQALPGFGGGGAAAGAGAAAFAKLRRGAGRGQARRGDACGRRCRARSRARDARTSNDITSGALVHGGAGHSGASRPAAVTSAPVRGRVRLVIPHARPCRTPPARKAPVAELARRPGAAGRGREPFRRRAAAATRSSSQQWR